MGVERKERKDLKCVWVVIVGDGGRRESDYILNSLRH